MAKNRRKVSPENGLQLRVEGVQSSFKKAELSMGMEAGAWWIHCRIGWSSQASFSRDVYDSVPGGWVPSSHLNCELVSNGYTWQMLKFPALQ